MKILMSLAGENDYIVKNDYDLIVAVDGGLKHLYNQQLKPNILIGDGDSNSEKFEGQEIKFLPKKDYTDFELALEYIKKTYGKNFEIDVIGFSSVTRIDHLIANIKLLKPNMTFINDSCKIKLLTKGRHTINYDSSYYYISFFTSKEKSIITIENAAYNVEEYNLEYCDVRCISNEFLDNSPINIDVKRGELIVIMSKKD